MIRVALADDHVLVREGVRRALDEAGDIDVVGEAGDGASAVEVARRLRPDVFVVDIAMPILNGVEATRQIRQVSENTVVLVLTAADEDEYVLSLLDAGATGYLSKTSSTDELLQALRGVHAGKTVLDASATRSLLQRTRAHSRTDGTEVLPLTDRERAVLELAAKGCTNKAIGAELSLSARTVQDHFEHVFGKLRVGSRTEAVARAMALGLIGRNIKERGG